MSCRPFTTIAVGAACLSCMLGPLSALGTSLVDQSFLWTSTGTVSTLHFYTVGQTFTVGASGLLTGVDLAGQMEPPSGSAQVLVEIRSTANGLPLADDAKVLSKITTQAHVFPLSNDAAKTTLTHFDLPLRGVPVFAGQVLAVDIVASIQANITASGYSGPGLYAAGDACEPGYNQSWSLRQPYPTDLYFQTYVEAAPGPTGPSSNSKAVSAGVSQSVTVTSSTASGTVAATFGNTTGGTLAVTHGLDTLLDLANPNNAQGAGAPTFALPTTGSAVEIWDLGFSGGTFSGPVQLVFQFDPTAMSLTQEQNVEIYHFSGGQWVGLAGTVDTTLHTVTVTTDSFSPFALGEVPEPASLALLVLGGLALLRPRR